MPCLARMRQLTRVSLPFGSDLQLCLVNASAHISLLDALNVIYPTLFFEWPACLVSTMPVSVLMASSKLLSSLATGEDQQHPPTRGGVKPSGGTGRLPLSPPAGDSGSDREKEGGEGIRHQGETKRERHFYRLTNETGRRYYSRHITMVVCERRVDIAAGHGSLAVRLNSCAHASCL